MPAIIAIASGILQGSQIIPPKPAKPDTKIFEVNDLAVENAELKFVLAQKNDEYSRLANIAVAASAITFVGGLVLGVLCWPR